MVGKNGAVEAIDVSVIGYRDKWTCHICGEMVDPLLAFPNPSSPSLDHSIPLARGGAHTASNVHLAHLGCNAKRGSRAARWATE